jgi:hypothetical protein
MSIRSGSSEGDGRGPARDRQRSVGACTVVYFDRVVLMFDCEERSLPPYRIRLGRACLAPWRNFGAVLVPPTDFRLGLSPHLNTALHTSIGSFGIFGR